MICFLYSMTLNSAKISKQPLLDLNPFCSSHTVLSLEHFRANTSTAIPVWMLSPLEEGMFLSHVQNVAKRQVCRREVLMHYL